MDKIKAIISITAAAYLSVVLCGCNAPPRQDYPTATTQTRASSAGEASAKRFQDTPLEGRTAVESAIELSEKYARLSDQTAALREENQSLAADNEALLQQIATLEAKLKKTQKELGEANDLLIEMLTELNHWKANILGFRGEMRDAAKAQLEALLKVLEILGGEMDAADIERRHATTLDAESQGGQSRNEPNASMAGEPHVP